MFGSCSVLLKDAAARLNIKRRMRMALVFALMVLVILYCCLRAGKDADMHAEQIYQQRIEEQNEVDYDAEADMLREAMEEEHW